MHNSSADIIKGAMIKLYNNPTLRKLGVYFTIQVHDELVFICPDENVEEAIDIIRKDMEHPFKKDLQVPLEVDIGYGQLWGESK